MFRRFIKDGILSTRQTGGATIMTVQANISLCSEFYVLGKLTVRYCIELPRKHALKADGDFVRTINSTFLSCAPSLVSRRRHELACNFSIHQFNFVVNDAGSTSGKTVCPADIWQFHHHTRSYS